MNLSEFIDQVGAPTVAKKLGTSESNVYTWKRLETVPRPLLAFRLIEMSLGALTWEGIFEPYVVKRYKVRRRKRTTS